MNALVIGGTGPTGPDAVAALLDRSFTVAHETLRRLSISLGWDGVDEAFDHPYDHPLPTD